MDKRLGAFTAFIAVTVLFAATRASAQSPPTQQPSHQQTEPGSAGMGQGGMMGRGMMRARMGPMMRRMRGGPMPGPMMRMFFALIDTDNDGTISLQEWQVAQERIFKAMDTDKDGTVSPEEMRAFMTGQTGSAPQH